jgi:mRNA-degrading endonuclease toxin of MazEF toxin-antitoxin module
MNINRFTGRGSVVDCDFPTSTGVSKIRPVVIVSDLGTMFNPYGVTPQCLQVVPFSTQPPRATPVFLPLGGAFQGSNLFAGTIRCVPLAKVGKRTRSHLPIPDMARLDSALHEMLYGRARRGVPPVGDVFQTQSAHGPQLNLVVGAGAAPVFQQVMAVPLVLRTDGLDPERRYPVLMLDHAPLMPLFDLVHPLPIRQLGARVASFEPASSEALHDIRTLVARQVGLVPKTRPYPLFEPVEDSDFDLHERTLRQFTGPVRKGWPRPN